MHSSDGNEKPLSDIVQSLRNQCRNVLSEPIPSEIERLLQALEDKEATIAHAATRPDTESRRFKSDRES